MLSSALLLGHQFVQALSSVLFTTKIRQKSAARGAGQRGVSRGGGVAEGEEERWSEIGLLSNICFE